MTIKLLQRTITLMDDLEKCDWFSNVGKKEIDGVVTLNNWDAALTSCSTLHWENLTLEAQNLITAQLCLHEIHRKTPALPSWNDIAAKVKERLVPLIEHKTSKLITEHELPRLFLHSVRWDIVGMCITCEFAEYYPSSFHQNMSRLYLAGHFPCGWHGPFPYGPDEDFPYSWEGDLPKGQFIIF